MADSRVLLAAALGALGETERQKETLETAMAAMIKAHGEDSVKVRGWRGR